MKGSADLGITTTGQIHLRPNHGAIGITTNHSSFKSDDNSGPIRIGRNVGAFQTYANKGTLNVDYNEGLVSSRFARGTVYVNFNGRKITSESTQHGHWEDVMNNQESYEILGRSDGSHNVGIDRGEVKIGNAQAPGLGPSGTVHIGTMNRPVTQFFEDGKSVTYPATREAADFNQHGKVEPSNFLATYQAGKALSTYVTAPIHNVGAYGIYTANVFSAPGAIAGAVGLFRSEPAGAFAPKPDPDASSTAGVEGLSATSVGATQALPPRAAEEVQWQTPPNSVPTAAVSHPDQSVTFDPAGFPQIHPGAVGTTYPSFVTVPFAQPNDISVPPTTTSSSYKPVHGPRPK